MKKLPYVPIVGLILKVRQEPDCCSSLITLRTEEGIANIQVSLDTKVIDNLRLRPGLRTAAFYDASLPVPLVYPPLYQAKIITRLDREEEIVLDYFDSDLTALDGSLKLVPGRETEIETINGQSFPCSIQNQTLLVYYSATTRSLPPQANPSRIIVIRCSENF